MYFMTAIPQFNPLKIKKSFTAPNNFIQGLHLENYHAISIRLSRITYHLDKINIFILKSWQYPLSYPFSSSTNTSSGFVRTWQYQHHPNKYLTRWKSSKNFLISTNLKTLPCKISFIPFARHRNHHQGRHHSCSSRHPCEMTIVRWRNHFSKISSRELKLCSHSDGGWRQGRVSRCRHRFRMYRRQG